MLKQIDIYGLLFIDIETVPSTELFVELTEGMQSLWISKAGILRLHETPPEESYCARAGVYAEFGKIICISLGYFSIDRDSNSKVFRIKSFSNHNERALLEEFTGTVSRFNSESFSFCGHNIKEFDIPYICRRLLVNKLSFPDMLDMSGKRPWEVHDVDTMQLWKFGDYKSYTSLKLLAEILNIPSSKNDIEGKDVANVYWKSKDLDRIVRYCEGDVITTARLLLRLKGETETLHDSQILFIE